MFFILAQKGDGRNVGSVISQVSRYRSLTRKVPIMTAADDNFYDIFHNFQKQ